jgi:hypothetical protein
MDKKKSIELIKLEVLGCLTEKDKESLKEMKLSNEDFPWKELAEYQKVISLLPSLLEIKYPSDDLKDKTAMKLYNLRDEIKAKIEAKRAQEVASQPFEAVPELEENPESEENNVFEEKVEVEEKVLVEAEVGIQTSEIQTASLKEEPFKITSKYKEKTETENYFQTPHDNEEAVISKQTHEKEPVEKIVRDYINAHLKREIESIKDNIKKNRLITFILFIITLILMGVLFFIK